MKCRACGGSLDLVLDLGRQPVSNGYLNNRNDSEQLHPLRAVKCESCHLLQVDADVPPESMFGADYAYFSGVSAAWLKHTQDYAEFAIKHFGLGRESVVIEIGGNDGHLLKHFNGTVARAINIEPSRSVAQVSMDIGVETWVEYWKPQQIQADLIIANNVMAHTPNLRGFVEALYLSMKPTGRATIEFPHALNLLTGTQFDTIYHEHYSYLSLLALDPLFDEFGLKAYDVERLPTHGGSLRLYVGRCQRVHERISLLRRDEEILKSPTIYKNFAKRAAQCRISFLEFLESHSPGSVLGYGAAAKGNTFLNYCRINPSQIPFVADATPAKVGKFLPGSRIEVISEKQLVAERPGAVLILPWNWKRECIERLSGLFSYKPHFITAIPKLRIE